MAALIGGFSSKSYQVVLTALAAIHKRSQECLIALRTTIEHWRLPATAPTIVAVVSAGLPEVLSHLAIVGIPTLEASVLDVHNHNIAVLQA
jgi:hypothetical protein